MPDRAECFRCGRANALLLAVMLIPAWAGASQWYIEPSANLGGFYDDNVRLSTDDSQSSFGAQAQAKVESGRRTEVSEIGIGARVSGTRYSDLSEFDETAVSLGLVSDYRLDRNRFGLNANVDYDSTLTSEIQTTGFVQVNKPRISLAINPSWSYSLSPRATLDAQVKYQDVSYEDVQFIPLYDYTFATAALTSAYALSERTKLSGRLSYDQYDAPKVDTRSNSVGLEVGLNHLLSETWTFSSFAGIRHASSETPINGEIDETENNGPLFQASLNKRFETGSLSMSASRSLLPSSNGTLLDTTGLALAFNRQFSSLWAVQIDVQGYRNRNPGGEISENDRDYIALEPRLERRLSDSLRLGLSYRYRWQTYESHGDAVSNAVFLTLNYVLPREPVGQWLR